MCSSDNLSKFCNAILSSQLKNILNGKDDGVTVFAPTNGAMERLKEVLDDDGGSMRDAVLFHVIQDKIKYASDLRCTEKQSMANGKDSRTVCTSKGVFQKGSGNRRNGMPKIVQTDIKSCNGVVHIIDDYAMLYKGQ